MEPIGPSLLSKPLIALGKALLPHAKRLYSERQAGLDGANVKTDFLDTAFEETLSRLQDIGANDAWWRRMLRLAESEYVRPEYLEKLSIRDWLRQTAVRDDLKTLARQRLISGAIDEEPVITRLAHRYASHTLELPVFGIGFIDSLVNILLAGALSDVNSGGRIILGTIQDAHEREMSLLREIHETSLREIHETRLHRSESQNVNQASKRKSQSISYTCFPSFHTTLYGRARELEKLTRYLAPSSLYSVVMIEAIGGMGKTALAREFCRSTEIWNAYDVVLGAQASKRQIRSIARAASSKAIDLYEQGKELNVKKFLEEIAEQLDINRPRLKTEDDLEGEIICRMNGRSALILLDNLETMDDTRDVLKLLGRVCAAPTQKALITARRSPEDLSPFYQPLRLGPLSAHSDCRNLVEDILRHSEIQPVSVSDEAIDAIVEVSLGHPLCLVLLSGKLISQKSSSILELRHKWRTDATTALDDLYLSALFDYVFDKRFSDHVGREGLALMNIIASYETSGIDEDSIRSACNLSGGEFDELLGKLFEAKCIDRGFVNGVSILKMHPITQVYFRALSP